MGAQHDSGTRNHPFASPGNVRLNLQDPELTPSEMLASVEVRRKQVLTFGGLGTDSSASPGRAIATKVTARMMGISRNTVKAALAADGRRRIGRRVG